jgi:predicted O-methyltransferase YrrM
MASIEWMHAVAPSQRWTFDDARFRVDDVFYLSTLTGQSNDDRLCIKKPPALVEATVALLEGFTGANIVELGISQGGSTALAAQVARPRKLVAFDISPRPIGALQQYLERSDSAESVRTYYGVDQADRSRIERVVDDEFAGEPLDLVIDDASHFLVETRASFEMLFPRLRPGGLYVIEDWNWQHLKAESAARAVEDPSWELRDEFDRLFKEAVADPSSREHAALARWLAEPDEQRDAAPTFGGDGLLTVLVLQLMLARAWSGDVISRLDVRDLWVVVHRGPAALDHRTFSLEDVVHDHFGLVARVMR